MAPYGYDKQHLTGDGSTVRPTLVVLDSQGSRVERVGFEWERGNVRVL
ncbi:MAG: hypothetical protein SNJ75_15975 [Gemmataceae bacterium]